ncbi:MAG: flagellar hook-basal body protein [Anaerolineales bacterium]|nr:flagellar hook-basal body protein [Anaerolineales bacterium]
MLKGLYAASSAMLANMERQKVLSHNVANVDTPGFKQLLVSLNEFLETPAYSGNSLSGLGSLDYLGALGLGVETGDEITDFSVGGISTTGEALDLAIDGAGFFMIETPQGTRYTRDGRLAVDVDGNLVNLSGQYILDANENRIQLDSSDFVVQPDGQVLVDGVEAGTIGLAAFEDPEAELERQAPGVFMAEGGATSDEVGTILQGALEGSNADPAQLMTQMVTVARAYEAAQRLVQVQDELLGRSIQTLGRL